MRKDGQGFRGENREMLVGKDMCMKDRWEARWEVMRKKVWEGEKHLWERGK